ncbi:uroporphyrinogen decarboxylase [Thermonema rossianum]|uniref:uroporphyrinogen decarboxylase n=1 Tax=Thermonema rossianum TaxID=55505 RepID=UPI000570B676|nr:uroporphyrinogen decarboxylase [Thermonema rossianum]
MALKNDLLLRAARGEAVERVPVWLMRQAGRVLPEYRAVRERLSGFIELVKTPELAAEVTIQPVDLLGVDAAIIFSDILVVPEAMGCPYEMVEKRGPFFPNTIRSEADLERLQEPEVEDALSYVLEAIRLTKKELNGRVPLIGFAGAPFTIFCYMVEGQGSKTFAVAKRMLYEAPGLAHRLLDAITRVTTAYLKAQIKAGADLVQLFDSWAGILSPQQYRAFALPYIRRICEAIQEVPVTVFAKGAHYIVPDLLQTDCQVIGLDWTMDLAQVRAQVGQQKTLQGNLDPCALYAPEAAIKQYVEQVLSAAGKQRYIANLGHGLYPDTDPARVRYFVAMVKELSAML